MEAQAARPPGASPPDRVTVAFDALGAEAGPEVVIEGVRAVAAEGIGVRVFGRREDLRALDPLDGVEVIATTESIGNDEEPVSAVRSRPEASIVRAAADVAARRIRCAREPRLDRRDHDRRAVRPEADPVRSAPGARGRDPRPRPRSPAAAARRRRQRRRPLIPSRPVRLPRLRLRRGGARVGPSRGSPCCRSAPRPRRAARSWSRRTSRWPRPSGIRFAGNVEGRELLDPEVEVLVTDGFTGNVVLKTIEGTARTVAEAVRSAARSGPRAAAGGLLLSPALSGLREDMDPDGTGGAILLGPARGRGRRSRLLRGARGRQPDPPGGPGGQRAGGRAHRGADRALGRRAGGDPRGAGARVVIHHCHR